MASGETPTSSVNMATQAGMITSISSLRTRRTKGSEATVVEGVWATISGWRARTSRAGPQLGSRSRQSSVVGSTGPTIEEQRRPILRARSAKARTAAGVAQMGTRLAPE